MYKMIELTRIMIGSLVLLLMTNESYQTECYARNGDLNPDGLFCFDTSHECWSDLKPTRLADLHNQFYLFTRKLTTEPNKCMGGRELLWDNSNTFSDFSSSKETIVIIHGWNSHSEDKYLAALCDSFMELDDYNIIMVNWKIAANNLNYWDSRLDSRLVAKELAVLLEKLHVGQGLQYANVHLLGHSLGAHLAGYTGKFLKGTIGHITGLDPANPNFKKYLNDPECHLDKTDANFVDVIHSDGKAHLLGLAEPVGHQDFYPNKGISWQPKCFFKAGCSHMRALDYYLSSMKNFDIQPGEECSFVTTPISPTTCSEVCPRMGIHAEKGDTGSFRIEMKSSNCGVKFLT